MMKIAIFAFYLRVHFIAQNTLKPAINTHFYIRKNNQSIGTNQFGR